MAEAGPRKNYHTIRYGTRDGELLFCHIHQDDNILRLNHIGTHPVYNDLAIDNALDYQEMIGMERKENRLRYIQRFWSERLRDVKKYCNKHPC